ncbi:OmpA family protein [Hellea sp.]|nr:OmpA family protein [Hellea sp.]
MKSRLLIAAASAALMAVPSIASAQDDSEGWYLRGNAGYGTHTDIDLEGDVISDIHGNGLQSEGNFAYSIGAGYDFGDNWRLEGDLFSLFTDLGSISQIPATSAKLRTNTAMINAIYDFDQFGKWEPYLGAGIGLVQGQLDLAAQDFLAPLALQNPACPGPRALLVNQDPGGRIQPESCSVSDRSTALGYQLLAGLGYQISDNLTWDTQYRYLEANEFDFNGVRTNQETGIATAIAVGASSVAAHSILTGFRYTFGQKQVAPPPPPPPPPPPVVQYTDCPDGSVVVQGNACPVVAPPVVYTDCPDGSVVVQGNACPVIISDNGNNMTDLCGEQFRQEIIYYEFNKGQSAETRNAVNRILDIGQFCNVDNIRVVGHTDRSGSAAYNLGLSQRRAKDARDELVRQGIAGERITSEGKGETENFVPTADGVKEQLNRRTEVLITLGSVGVIN